MDALQAVRSILRPQSFRTHTRNGQFRHRLGIWGRARRKLDLLALLWHFGSVLKNPPVAVRATIRNRRRSEQLGDDGAADLRQRWLRRWSAGHHLFFGTVASLGVGAPERYFRICSLT